jgi:D-aminopeptidase
MRARDYGLPTGFFPAGPENAITDVPGVVVGHCTVLHGEGQLVPGEGPVRTGVTIVGFEHSPRGIYLDRLAAGAFVLNGAGELTGYLQAMEWGMIESPIALTNTHSVGVVRKAIITYMAERYPGLGVTYEPIIPVVGECDDSYLNDIRGGHVREEHVKQALNGARSGPVAEGSVGAGTGMVAFDYKAGIGTASRLLPPELGGYTVGVLVNSNFGERRQLRLGGFPVGRFLPPPAASARGHGSVVVVVVTDAPLLARQLSQLARRAALGIARTGSAAATGSGEIIIAVSTGNIIPRRAPGLTYTMTALTDHALNPLYEAVVECVEESIANSLFAAGPMTGRDGHRAPALPVEEVAAMVAAVLEKFRPGRSRVGQ